MALVMYGEQFPPDPKPETFLLSQEALSSLPRDIQMALDQVDRMKRFLHLAPVQWNQDQYIRRFLLPTGEYVSCVLWNGLFHITGTDIVRSLSFRFQAFGRPVRNSKKFEEGIFSDLRNLKPENDATLEEPKSMFLDFLYKNNCIRTQKKQKVFFWYSVPHDRLFLDALERDLKREKTNQEPTTVAVSEPALSFEYDSSTSLYEQVMKQRQAHSSSYAAHAAFPQNPSPVDPGIQMPPPQMIPQQIPQQMPVVHEEMEVQGYPQQMMQMPPPVKREDEFVPYYSERGDMPLARPQHGRTISMHSFLEYSQSPAPSFTQSDDYSQRGISYEPTTPPQQMVGMPEPQYLAHDGTATYHDGSSQLGGMVPVPMSSVSAPPTGFATTPRGFGGPIYQMVPEGSPTYKQRRRRSSITPGLNGHGRRPSRSTPASVAEHPSDPEESPANAVQHQYQPREIIDLSRNGTPMSAMEASPGPRMHDGSPMPQGYGMDDERRPGAIRRAKSATILEAGAPYKSHTCPIAMCSRNFKRLEHLKRHVRTHTQERPYICGHCQKAFSRSDNLAQHKRTHDRDLSNGQEQYSYNDQGLEHSGELSSPGEHMSSDSAEQSQQQIQHQSVDYQQDGNSYVDLRDDQPVMAPPSMPPPSLMLMQQMGAS